MLENFDKMGFKTMKEPSKYGSPFEKEWRKVIEIIQKATNRTEQHSQALEAYILCQKLDWIKMEKITRGRRKYAFPTIVLIQEELWL